jgi:hypothetical protein
LSTDEGCDAQIKLQSVKLAMKYLKRVSSELEVIKGGPEEEELMLQGVRFAFRVHQVYALVASSTKHITSSRRERIYTSIVGHHYGRTKTLRTAWFLLRAVCWRVRRGHHASLPGAQGEGVHVPDTTAEPSSAAAQARC